MNSIVLASQSQQRQALLAALQIPFETISTDLDELAITHPDHQTRAAMVAEAKAQRASVQFPEHIIIAADTFVVLKNQRLEKPLDEMSAEKMLAAMSGQAMEVYTGWAYWDACHSLHVNQTTQTLMTFRALTLTEIKAYIHNYPVTNWAGSFSVSNSEGLSFLASVQGSLTSILGLPVEELMPLLEQSGVLPD